MITTYSVLKHTIRWHQHLTPHNANHRVFTSVNIHICSVEKDVFGSLFFPLCVQAEHQAPAYLTTGQFAPQALGGRDRPQPVHNARHQAFDMRMQSRDHNNRVSLDGCGRNCKSELEIASKCLVNRQALQSYWVVIISWQHLKHWSGSSDPVKQIRSGERKKSEM